MADIQPFRAFRYDIQRVALKDVLTQPYDKITPAMQEAYYAASPYNLITVEKGRTFPEDTPENSVYTRAGRKVQEWIAEKIWVEDAKPSVYVYSEEFEVPGSRTRRVRTGFIALARVEDYDAKVVFRHERTLSGPKADRIELLRNTRAQTGQHFFLYDDAAGRIDARLEEAMGKSTPLEMVDEYGVTHRLWPTADRVLIAAIQREMKDKKLVIADGHHRYETALAYRNESRERARGAGAAKSDPMAAPEFAMATFINTHSKGLVILPTHRVVSRMANFDFDAFRQVAAKNFDWYAYPFTNPEERPAAYAEFRKDFQSHRHGRRVIGVYGAGGTAAQAFYLFALQKGADLEQLLPDVSEAQRGLDVVLLHRLILEKYLGITAEAVTAEKNVTYERELDAAIAAVDSGAAQLALLLNPVSVNQVAQIAIGGDVMPQKSTDFYPKLLSGLAIYRVEGRLEGLGEK
jgi:uncharacterized protein (DUF1015 family)